ncbi:cobalamin biosynthesis protein [Actinocrinis puniceicyclus]|uniref:Cobalamin biosynthesis protein CobD n=1 Tax=Actinocrinis puniceicyclus TaxID=977794 RepID=A0A8J8BGB0_9ACTN|nr:cobalamin biosynthesis protein [Actinocrinis puniceicyclus]MBS2966951.1 cobalamin biosynthesis protein [Actinocrinis puniceicyclus]
MRRRSSGAAAALGLVAGYAVDALVADPSRGHPVAAFGRAATALERRCYQDSRSRGTAFTAVCVGGTALFGYATTRGSRGRPVTAVATMAAATWSVVGAASLRREAAAIGSLLEAGDLDAARERLPRLCGRDPRGMDEREVARAVVESVAENTSDAVVAPLFWGAVAGVPGLLGYRAANTLDAMVGHRSQRYARFGWASARLDDALNLAPARLTGALTAVLAPTVGGSRLETWHTLRHDGGKHPSPNAGRCEAAAAGALGLRLGGTNSYTSGIEHRPYLGTGRGPRGFDIARANRLSAAVSTAAAAGLSVGALALRAAAHRRGSGTR